MCRDDGSYSVQSVQNNVQSNLTEWRSELLGSVQSNFDYIQRNWIRLRATWIGWEQLGYVQRNLDRFRRATRTGSEQLGYIQSNFDYVQRKLEYVQSNLNTLRATWIRSRQLGTFTATWTFRATSMCSEQLGYVQSKMECSEQLGRSEQLGYVQSNLETFRASWNVQNNIKTFRATWFRSVQLGFQDALSNLFSVALRVIRIPNNEFSLKIFYDSTKKSYS